MLTKDEIKQFHQFGRIFREGKIHKVPYVVRTLTVGDNMAYAAEFDKLRISDTNERIFNLLAYATLNRCLVSFNNQKLSPEEIAKFSIPKANIVLDAWDKLYKDLKEYLEGYDEKPIDPEEVEEFILTDRITRTETLQYEEDVPPLVFTYQTLSLGEHEAIQRDIELTENMSRWHAEAIKERAYAAHVIVSINGVKVTPENIDDFSTDLVGFILKRAVNLENQMQELLRDPKKMGETLKKS